MGEKYSQKMFDREHVLPDNHWLWRKGGWEEERKGKAKVFLRKLKKNNNKVKLKKNGRRKRSGRKR